MSAAALAAPRALSVKDIEDALITIDDRFYTYALSALLVVVGLYFTVRTRGVQVRRFGTMMRTITGSPAGFHIILGIDEHGKPSTHQGLIVYKPNGYFCHRGNSTVTVNSSSRDTCIVPPNA